MTVEANQGGHSPIGGSVAHRFINCPAAPGRSKGLDDENSLAADEGSFAHYVGQQILIHGQVEVTSQAVINYEPVFNVQPDRGTPPKEYVLGMYGQSATEMAGRVQKYVDTIRSFIVDPAKDILWIEHKVILEWLHPDLRGIVDASVHKEAQKGLIVTDYKDGYVPVEVVDNAQLKYYALGELGKDNPRGIERVSLCIVQPKANHQDGPVRYWEISAEELIKWGYEVLAPAARATDLPNAPIKVGPWCKYCPANTRTCQGVTETALTLAPYVAGKEVMDEATLVKALDFIEMFKDWAPKIQAGATHSAKNGTKIPGRKLVRAITNRKWANEEAALQQLKCLHGPSVLQEPKEKLKSFTVLGKELPEGALTGLLEKPEGALILVPEKDSRKEVIAEPGAVFAEVAKPSAVQQMTDEYTKKKESS